MLPKGCTVGLSVFTIHRNPEYWPDPDTFNPDRFDHPPVAGTYLPFGGGERICIGNRFAMLEMKTVRANCHVMLVSLNCAVSGAGTSGASIRVRAGCQPTGRRAARAQPVRGPGHRHARPRHAPHWCAAVMLRADGRIVLARHKFTPLVRAAPRRLQRAWSCVADVYVKHNIFAMRSCRGQCAIAAVGRTGSVRSRAPQHARQRSE